MSIKAVLFDLVGTIISEEKVLEKSDEIDANFLKEAGVPSEKIKEFNRKKLKALKIFDSLPNEEVVKVGKFYEVALDLVRIKLPKK